MNLVPIDESWTKDLVSWFKDATFVEYMMEEGETPIDWLRRTRQHALVGLEEGDFRGCAFLRLIGDDMGELALYAPLHAFPSLRVIFDRIENDGRLKKLVVKMKASRFRNWEKKTLSDWERLTRKSGFTMSGLVRDPSKDSPYLVVGIKEFNHEHQQ